MDTRLQEIISKSSFQVINGWYVYAKVRSLDDNTGHFMVTRDKDEITVVTQTKNVEDLDLIEHNQHQYQLLTLNVSVPFYAVGFLAAITETIAQEGLNILVVSTYPKDYIFIREGGLEKATQALIKLGFHQTAL